MQTQTELNAAVQHLESELRRTKEEITLLAARIDGLESKWLASRFPLTNIAPCPN